MPSRSGSINLATHLSGPPVCDDGAAEATFSVDFMLAMRDKVWKARTQTRGGTDDKDESVERRDDTAVRSSEMFGTRDASKDKKFESVEIIDVSSFRVSHKRSSDSRLMEPDRRREKSSLKQIESISSDGIPSWIICKHYHNNSTLQF